MGQPAPNESTSASVSGGAAVSGGINLTNDQASIGGNGNYIYWVNERLLPGDEYTTQGKSCEPQAVALGVTSAGQAVKNDVVLKSPLAACLKEQPR